MTTFAPPQSAPWPLQRSVEHMRVRSSATIHALIEPGVHTGHAGVARRLTELGFLPGETVTLLRRGPGGREPIAVQIGETLFALRCIEAACIQVVEHAQGLQP